MKSRIRSVWNNLTQKPNRRGSARLFEILVELNKLDPSILDWVKPIDNGRILMTQFKCPEFIHYSGKEIAVFSDVDRAYYRLPGALPNGGGQVENGEYDLLLTSFKKGEPNVKIRLQKESDNQILWSPMKKGKCRRLEMRFYDYDKELEHNVRLWIETFSKRIKTDASIKTSIVNVENFNELMDKCAEYTNEANEIRIK